MPESPSCAIDSADRRAADKDGDGGHSKAEIVSALKAAFANKQLPDLENGAMAFMMSKSAYLFDAGDHNAPHVMFFTALKDGKDWGAGASGSPVVSGPYWFLSSKEPSQAKG